MPHFKLVLVETAMHSTFSLNEQALRLADQMAGSADRFRITIESLPGEARIIDCGVKAEGSLNAGLLLARICMADLGEVALLPGTIPDLPCPQIQVASDHPVLACMASQYAGWQILVGKYFAMGSGPLRAAYGNEELFAHIPGRERPAVAVGVLETSELPGPEVTAYLAERLQLPREKLTLLCARSASLCGTMQVVARSLETALHKLESLHFDLGQILAGYGTAPLPPVAKKDLAALGRMNDAILYGGQVVLWVRADDDQLAELGPKVPSSASSDHGEPFVDVFKRAGHDFYKVDKSLFSPAQISFQNLRSGRTHTFGRLAVDVLQRSFFTDV
jgi:methenyltetrahydromethanopterin cyclohydrolase